MKIVKFGDKKAELKNELTPKAIIKDLVDREDIEAFIYITREKGGEVYIGNSTMMPTETLGLLRIGEQIIMNSLYEEEWIIGGILKWES